MTQLLHREFWTQAVAVAAMLICSQNAYAQQQQPTAPLNSAPSHGIVHQLMQPDPTSQRSNPQSSQPILVNAMRTPLQSEPAPVDRVQRAVYMPSEEQAWNKTDHLQQVSAQEPGDAPTKDSSSFIDREKTEPSTERATAQELIRKISINLAVVLALALGGILMVKFFQKSRAGQQANVAGRTDALNVSQVLPLTNGASLHVVEGTQNKFLVAIDSGGIKSVNVLVQSFEDTLERAGAFDSTSTKAKLEPIVHDETTAEIDENLIKLLLKSTKQAA